MKLPAALLLAAAAPAMAQDQPVFGTWRTETSASGAYLHVYIAPCGYDTAATCGLIVRALNGAREDLIGAPIITGMRDEGRGRWGKGQIWVPDDDRTYRSSMQIEDGTLTVTGCLALFCRSQIWTRVE